VDMEAIATRTDIPNTQYATMDTNLDCTPTIPTITSVVQVTPRLPTPPWHTVWFAPTNRVLEAAAGEDEEAVICKQLTPFFSLEPRERQRCFSKFVFRWRPNQRKLLLLLPISNLRNLVS
jgi:hypothetical protein